MFLQIKLNEVLKICEKWYIYIILYIYLSADVKANKNKK